MNFESILGLHSPIGFWITVVVMLIVVAGLLVLFWRKRWICAGTAGGENVSRPAMNLSTAEENLSRGGRPRVKQLPPTRGTPKSV